MRTFTVRVKYIHVMVLALAILLAGKLPAQTVQGVVTGTVTDTSGAVLPNAAVTLTNEGTGVTQTTTTNTNGGYRFALVPPGVYTVDVKVSGFNERQIK